MPSPPKTMKAGINNRATGDENEPGVQVWHPWRSDGPSIVYVRNFNDFDVATDDPGFTQAYEWRRDYTKKEQLKTAELPNLLDRGVLIRHAGLSS